MPIILAVAAVVVVGMLVCGGVLLALLLPAVQTAREAARRSQCTNNLKQIGLALQNYHDVYGAFPPAYLADEDGKPMHSWRVLILPFLEQKPLYDRYRFDEPWDGPNNRLLAASMPTVFRCASEQPSPPGVTSYVGVSGPGAIFDGAKPTAIFSINDGTSNTLMVVEFAGNNIQWLEPRDLDASQLTAVVNAPDGVNISSEHPGGANALFADGHVQLLSSSISSQTLHDLTTINGGEPIQGF
ncbi:MAG TPA: DUF1559 domain-containing protein [Pirellulales bacterium]|nr:DUF1559 domain-containing protein [Pirellulales bacterium]